MSQGRKRTKIALEKTRAPIISLRFEDMVLSCGNGQKAHPNRLRYRNVPTIDQIASGGMILLERDNIVRKIHQTLNDLPDNLSKQAYFSGVVNYFKYLDDIDHQEDMFSCAVMAECIKYFNRLREKGQRKSVAHQIKAALSFLLREWGRESDLKTLPEVAAAPPATNKAFNAETELRVLSKILVKGALAFQKAIDANILLETHPFFDEELFSEQARHQGWTAREIVHKKKGFTKCMLPTNATIKVSSLSIERLRKQTFYNHASRNWFFVFSMLTGMNLTVLANVRYKDVSFKSIGSGRFVFEGEKFRAGYKGVDNSGGFSQRTKELIVRWINSSKVMYQSLNIPFSHELPLCPFFNIHGEVWSFARNGSNIETLNIQLKKITGLKVTTSRFRATKSDVLMRVTEDIFLVSLGLNNTVSVVAQRYSSGVQADHDNNLNATFSTLSAVAKGEEIGKAVADAKVLHSDILSDYDYKNLRNREDQKQPLMTTPTGIRCAGATPDKLIAEARRMKQLGIDFSKDTGRCTDFLACLYCDRHKLVASENDIWLMLSFFERIEELKEIVASNSTPNDEYYEVQGILKKLLLRLEKKAPKNYAQAKQKIEDCEFHPLYLDRASASQFFKG